MVDGGFGRINNLLSYSSFLTDGQTWYLGRLQGTGEEEPLAILCCVVLSDRRGGYL